MTRQEPKSRGAYRVWTSITTRWLDNDAYGHVNNAVHYQWFDTAVNAWLIERGLLDVATGDPIGLVVETGCRYFQSVSYPETVEIGFAIEKIGRSSIRYRLGVFPKGQDNVIAEGFFVHVLVDRTSRRPTAIPPFWQKELDQICEA